MPFCHVPLATRSPLPVEVTERPRTLAEHLRLRRHRLGQLKMEAAAAIGASPFTYANWEAGRTTPGLKWRTPIHAWLGYCPVEPRSLSLGERVRRWRLGRGLSLKEVAGLAGLDAGTVGRAERGARLTHASRNALGRVLARSDAAE